MNKKIGVSILLGVLVLIGVVFMAKFAYGDTLGTATNIVVYGDGYGLDNTTKGGVSEIVNLTIMHDGVSETNISAINVSWSGNYSFNGWVSLGDVWDNPTEDEVTSPNATINAAGAIGNWNCTNSSLTSLFCYNNSGSSLGPADTSLIIRFNATAASNKEDRNAWNVTVYDIGDPATDLNSTILYTYIDGLAPRLAELNISDGNMSYGNGTFNGNGSYDFGGYATYLDSGAPLEIRATFFELTPSVNDIVMYYNASVAPHSINDDGDSGTLLYGSTNRTVGSNCIATERSWDWDNSTALTCSWTIPANTATTNGTILFGFYVNDTFNTATTINDTSAIGGLDGDVGFSIATNATLPYISVINVSDYQSNVITNLKSTATDYLNAQTTIRFEVTGGPRAVADTTLVGGSAGYIVIYYNMTGTPTIGVNGNVENYDAILTNITQSNNVSTGEVENTTNLQDPTYTSFYSVDFTDVTAGIGNGSASDTTKIANFVIVIGNTSTDNLNGNYTRIQGPYSFRIDTSAPAITVTKLTSSSGVNQYDSSGVEYKCETSDSSGIQKYVWTLDRPGSTPKTTEVLVGDADSSSYDKIVFKDTDLNVLGDYTVKCKVYDNVDNPDEKTGEGFSVSAVGGAVSGGAGGGGGAAVVSFDIDFTTANEGTLKAQQGRVKSFSFDGVTKHTVTFIEVTGTSATLKIESTPVTVTLNVRDTKNVDVNGDGANDVGVTLNSIVNGVADITIKKIEEGAAKIVKEEESARGVTEEQQAVTPVEKGVANTWIWILIAVIIIAALAYYFFNKKK